ncbi:MAG: MerR family transcriptional regulator [Myxococcales bacterium]|nr:MerR family transcriptional regulator [Myxococcales bacterium]MCB9533982.1 MerR family transcriptional regulator [Myxococcales bacterium]
MVTAHAESELYPMRVVTRVTGVPPDTIRAWERRYAALVPRRTDGNARRYSAADIRKLTLLRDLTERGHAIGEVAPLEMDALEDLVGAEEARAPRAPTPDDPTGVGRVVDDYLSAVARMDTARASEILLRAAAVLDNRALVFDLVVPIAQEVGARWSHGAIGIAQEHLVSAELRSLLSARGRIYTPDPGAPRLVVATPAGHRHEFGVLAAAMLANGRGIDVLYLGSDLPDRELAWSAAVKRADVLVLGIAVHPDATQHAALTATLSTLSESVEVWLGCPEGVSFAQVPGRLRLFHSLDDFDVALVALRR